VSNAQTVVPLVISVFVASAIFGWMMLRWAKSLEKTYGDPKSQPRKLIWGGVFYLGASTV
jgi:hypothetical protein